MIKRMVIMLILVGLVLGGIFGFQAFKAVMIKRFFAHRTAPPQTVSTIEAKDEVWQPEVEAVGSLVAVNGADVAPEVPGVIARISFKSGQEVQAGTPLVQLDADVDQARLRSLQAMQTLAEKTYQRDVLLIAKRAISQSQMDTAHANQESARAQVAEQQAVISKKTIRAPFAGRLGIRAVDLGQYVNPGTKIVTLQALDPIYVDFHLPQKIVTRITVGQQVQVHTDALPKEAFTGVISAIEPIIETSTRNVKVRAEVQNPKHLLLPGMFVTTRVHLGSPEKHITLPQTSITFNPYGNIVYLVEEDGKGPDGKPKLVAHQKFVTTGDTRGDQIAVLEGLKPGQTVVTSGQLKLRNGTPVVINNSIQPTNNPAPTPKDE
ncbi:MAG TPA: efflux RND transporter periplasmic adaptor subunit [bacterium]|nr:efflux RND transporter periplasmic adaptor subunit [bacterium]